MVSCLSNSEDSVSGWRRDSVRMAPGEWLCHQRGNGCAINKGIKPGDGGVRLVSDIQIKIIKWKRT